MNEENQDKSVEPAPGDAAPEKTGAPQAPKKGEDAAPAQAPAAAPKSAPQGDGRGENAVGDTRSLLLQLALHEESTLNNRVNIFLVVESLMLVLYAEVVKSNESLALPIAAVGILLTLIWLLTSVRQGADLKYSVIALRDGWPEIIDIYKPVPAALKTLSLFLLVWALPLLFVGVWIVIAGDYAELISLWAQEDVGSILGAMEP